MEKLRQFLETSGGKAMAGGMIALTAIFLFFALKGFFGGSEGRELSAERVFICSETKKPFEHTLVDGESYPVKSPHSGKLTGYPAELCYWTSDGTIKEKPTAVLLNTRIGVKGATFCHECGRLVVGHNPKPNQGDTPPPTQSEYKPRPTRSRE